MSPERVRPPLHRAFGRDIREGTRTAPDFDHAVELTRLVRAVIVADQSGVRQRDEGAWRGITKEGA